jgi:hypothetical protein
VVAHRALARPSPRVAPVFEALDYSRRCHHNLRDQAFGNWRPLQIGAAILSLIAFLAWVILLLMFAVTAARWAIQFRRNPRAPTYN